MLSFLLITLIFTNIKAFVIITERDATMIIHHLSNFDAHPALFQIQNGGCVIWVYALTIFYSIYSPVCNFDCLIQCNKRRLQVHNALLNSIIIKLINNNTSKIIAAYVYPGKRKMIEGNRIHCVLMDKLEQQFKIPTNNQVI